MCTITKHLEIRPANRTAYDELAQFHYRAACPAVYTAIYAMYDIWHGRVAQPPSAVSSPVGVIVYTMPSIGLEMRNIATGSIFDNCSSRSERMKMINKNIRCISRVIIEPRYRGLGLAARLVRETMPLMNVPIIEAIAAMGRVNPFFEKVGMKPYPAKVSRQCQRLRAAFAQVGIKEHLFIRPVEVQKKLDAMCGQLRFWIEHHISRFMQAYGKRRNMPPGLQRTRFILSKLTAEPVYYIWFKKPNSEKTKTQEIIASTSAPI
jgi:hypothetical protein